VTISEESNIARIRVVGEIIECLGSYEIILLRTVQEKHKMPTLSPDFEHLHSAFHAVLSDLVDMHEMLVERMADSVLKSNPLNDSTSGT
jgi:hypothetical protein